MRILHSVYSLGSKASGLYHSVPSIAKCSTHPDNTVELWTVGDTDLHEQGLFSVRSFAPDPMPFKTLNKLVRSDKMRVSALRSQFDIYHIHGLWAMPAVYPAEAARRFRKPLLISPHGMLGRDALQFSKAAKIAFSFLWQQNVLRSATCFHATADSEVDDIREFGMRQPVAVIPNGIHLPKLESFVPAQQHYPGGQTVPFILSLGRIHPKKALDRLISAFALVAPTATNWRLRIVGQDERGYASQLQGLVRQHALCGKVTIEPPVYGEEKYRLMREAAVFVLPSLHENFANVVAESLSVETPVISSKGAPWSGLVSNKCGWWVEHGSAAIAEALSEAMRMPAEVRREMGVRGRAWIGRDFGWDGVQSKFLELHRWVSGQGDIPQFIRFK